MNIKVIQFGEGKDSEFLVVDADTEKPLFEVKLYDSLDGYAHASLSDVFKRILAKWKKEIQAR